MIFVKYLTFHVAFYFEHLSIEKIFSTKLYINLMSEKMHSILLSIVFNIDSINNQASCTAYHRKMPKMYALNYNEIVRMLRVSQFIVYRYFVDIKAGCYHAGLSAPSRTHVHEKWLKNQVHVICATIAFGLIDEFFF